MNVEPPFASATSQLGSLDQTS